MFIANGYTVGFDSYEQEWAGSQAAHEWATDSEAQIKQLMPNASTTSVPCLNLDATLFKPQAAMQV